MWAKVVGRREKAALKKASKTAAQKEPTRQRQPRREPRVALKKARREEKPRIKPTRRAAVAITLAPGSAKSCGEVLAAARDKIRLSEIGVSNAKIKQTMAGGTGKRRQGR